MMLAIKDVQQALIVQGAIIKADGALGPDTNAAIGKLLIKRIGAEAGKWPAKRQLLAIEQLIMKDAGIDVGAVDGLMGPSTQYALEKWQDRQRDLPSLPPAVEPHPPAGQPHANKWPYQSQCMSFYGPVGQNQVIMEPPYPMFLYDTKTPVHKISLHAKVAPSAVRVLTKVMELYSADEINSLHLNRYFGSLNVRKMRGGSSWSMHSWGIAIDFDANNNAFRSTRETALFAKPAYDKWWAAWEGEGWVSLGRSRNYDWMHVQAARL